MRASSRGTPLFNIAENREKKYRNTDGEIQKYRRRNTERRRQCESKLVSLEEVEESKWQITRKRSPGKAIKEGATV